MGSLMLVWFEGDVEKAFAELATDDSEYTTWLRARVLATGVDLGTPSDDPPPAVLVDYRLTCDAARIAVGLVGLYARLSIPGVSDFAPQ